MDDSCKKGMLLGFFFGCEIAKRCTLRDTAESRDRTKMECDGLSKRGFPGIRRPKESDVVEIVGGHEEG
jgi:hypothetical protein